jgi:diadenosine tetraphosphate (Ap4A) HIT family hydrolase
MTFEDKARVRAVCEQHLQEFMQERGLAIWDYRLYNPDPVPDVLRYRAIAEGGGRCALCGATKDQHPLHVDHIVPRSRGGKNTLENLQVLCSRCNLAKGNKDTADFRASGTMEADAECPFCPPAIVDRIIEDNGSAFAVPDQFPASPGHMLVLPHRHTPDYFSMTGREWQDAEDLLRYLRNKTQGEDATVVGFNVGANCGAAAGQTIMHAHIHLIPRRAGDTPDPRGGVRGAVPGRMSY